MAAKARKISPALEERLKSVAPDEPLEVVLQLEPPQIPQEGTRAERIDATKSKFDRTMTDLAGRVSSAGGKVLDGSLDQLHRAGSGDARSNRDSGQR